MSQLGTRGRILHRVLLSPALGMTWAPPAVAQSRGQPRACRPLSIPTCLTNCCPVFPPVLFTPFPIAAQRLIMNFDSYNTQVIISKRMENNYLLCWGIR